MLYTFSGNSGVLVDDLGLVAAAGLAPTGQVSYQFVVDTDRPSITTDWTGAVFEYGGAVGDRRFYATLVSRPYLVSDPSQGFFGAGERGQSLNSLGLLAGNIGVEFGGLVGTPIFGDSYNIGIGVSSFSDVEVLFENWNVGELFGGGETYRAMDGRRSAFSAYLRLESIEPYRIDEPPTIFMLVPPAIALLFRRTRRQMNRRINV